jgi:putative hydrolase
MDRVDAAIQKATYFLDRELAPSSKLRAFSTAQTRAHEVGIDELETRTAAGTLRDLDGIGPSTATVIANAIRGEECDYLAKLDARSTVRISPDGQGYLDALRGDCHMHSTWSDGGAPIEAMASAARALGHEYIVLTDHSARLTIAHGLNEERLARQLDEIAALNEQLAPFRILTGMEVDIFEDGGLDLSESMLSRLDIVVASVHSKFGMPTEQMTQRLVVAAANPHVDIIGHITNRKVIGGGRAGSTFDAEIVFAACARFDTAVEINCRPERQDPPEELLSLAVEWQCPIAIDTDAHAPGQLEWQAFGCDKAAACDVPVASVINTLPVDELIAWAA